MLTNHTYNHNPLFLNNNTKQTSIKYEQALTLESNSLAELRGVTLCHAKSKNWLASIKIASLTARGIHLLINQFMAKHQKTITSNYQSFNEHID